MLGNDGSDANTSESGVRASVALPSVDFRDEAKENKTAANPLSPAHRFLELKKKVDPALAALVVRQYLLPMFEGKPGAVAVRGIEELLAEPSVGEGPGVGIYGELKLSDQLLDELRQTKNDTNGLTIKLLDTERARDTLSSKVEAMKKDIQRAVQTLCRAKVHEQTLRQESAQVGSELSLLTLQSEELAEETRKLQAENSRMSTRLLEEEGKVERLSQVVAQNENTSSLSQLESDVLQGQVQSLHSRVAGLFGQTKNSLDDRAFDLAMYEIDSTKVYVYCSKIEDELRRVMEEKETLSREQAELQESKTKLEVLRKRLSLELNEQKQKIQASLLKMHEEKEQLRKEKEKLAKKLKELTEDRDKLKQRMKKYRLRRMFDQDTSTCRSCGKDFVKTENFNWSCRTHTSEFGGEMWWCCGKLGTDALGCKFNKHESKDDDDDLDEKEKKEKDESEQRIRNLNVKCFGCMDVGHKASNCLRDPNIRTNYNPQKELHRLSQAYDADASKKQLRQIDSHAIAGMVNEKIGFVAMKVESADEAPPLFADLMETSRLNLKRRRQEKAELSDENYEKKIASSKTEAIWNCGYESPRSNKTLNTEDSSDDRSSTLSSDSDPSSEDLSSKPSDFMSSQGSNFVPGRFLNFT